MKLLIWLWFAVLTLSHLEHSAKRRCKYLKQIKCQILTYTAPWWQLVECTLKTFCDELFENSKGLSGYKRLDGHVAGSFSWGFFLAWINVCCSLGIGAPALIKSSLFPGAPFNPFSGNCWVYSYLLQPHPQPPIPGKLPCLSQQMQAQFHHCASPTLSPAKTWL